MKKKIITLMLTASLLFSTLSLTSCIMLDEGVLSGDGASDIINVTGGDNYDVTINNPPASEVSAAAKALLSAVSIVAQHTSATSNALDGKSTVASGSGVIYSLDKERGDAYIITNHHVVYSSSLGISNSISVYLYGMESADCEIQATYVGGSLYYDLAVLQVKSSKILMSSNATAATFADSDSVNVLDSVIAIGNAGGDGISATAGHVNVDSEYISMLAADEKTQIALRVMRTDAAVNPGNSGGGLFNTGGEVIGIVNAKNSDDSVDNIGYAIPSNVAAAIAENIIYYCAGTNKTSVYRCMLGVEIQSQSPCTVYDTEAGIITKCEDVVIVNTTSATAAGIFKSGDVLLSITVDGVTTEITRRHQVVDAMLHARTGSVISFVILRGGEKITKSLTATSSMLEEY